MESFSKEKRENTDGALTVFAVGTRVLGKMFKKI